MSLPSRVRKRLVTTKAETMNKTVITVVALLVIACLFSNDAGAVITAVNNQDPAGKKIVPGKTIKKKNRGKQRRPPVLGGMERRTAALKKSFLRAGIGRDEIEGIFSDPRMELYAHIYSPTEPKAGEKKKLNYFDDEFGLFKPASIAAGKKILADNRDLFEQIENHYGVPANYIVAIIRIETNFKEHLGKYSVFNALYTMAMLDKRAKRVEMAHRELVAWVKMCRQKGMDPFTMKGSWAGAFGIPQFMPSSYTIFAVDHDGDGKADLYDYPDAFASIANYLHHMGWKTGNERKMRRAVYCYNHEQAYVNAVFAYAERL
jgi:membrane-bound lytic murein transglycosylase B